MKYKWLFALLIFIFSFSSISDPEIDRFGFEIELDLKQLEEVVDYFDFDEVPKTNILKSYSKKLDNYLTTPEIFFTLPPELQEEIISGVPKTTFTKTIIKEMNKTTPSLPSTTVKLNSNKTTTSGLVKVWKKIQSYWSPSPAHLNPAPKKISQLEFNIGWKKFQDYWNTKVDFEKKVNSVKMNQLPKSLKAQIFLMNSKAIKLKDDKTITPKIKKLFKNLEFFRDQFALEFRYLYEYKVHSQDQFIDEVDEISKFLKVDKLLNAPLKLGSSDLSIHIHLSGPRATNRLGRLWNDKILIDHLHAGFKEELFGKFGYNPDINKFGSRTGFVREIKGDQKHIELRNLSMSPKEALKLNEDDLAGSIIKTLNQNSITGTPMLELLGKYSPEAILSITETIPSWTVKMNSQVLADFIKNSNILTLNTMITAIKSSNKRLGIEQKELLSQVIDQGFLLFEKKPHTVIDDQRQLDIFIKEIAYTERDIPRLIDIATLNIEDEYFRRSIISSLKTIAKNKALKVTKKTLNKKFGNKCVTKNTTSQILSKLTDSKTP